VSAASLVREIRALIEVASDNGADAIPGDPIEFATLVGIDPEGWQADILTSEHKAKVLLCARRTGKSTTAAVMALHKALINPGFETIFVARNLEQAQIPYLMAVSMYRSLGRPVPAISERRTGLELANGATMRAMSAVERSKRGFSADFLCVDEASRIDEPAYYGALLPSITRSAGYVWLMSTPATRHGFFADTWHDDGDEWERTKITVEDSEYFQAHPEKLEMVRSKVPDWYWRREYLCEFLEDEQTLFSHADIEAAVRAGEDLQALEFEEDTW